MKKIIALLLTLCMALCCVSALAEALQADGSPVDFDGFILNLEEGVVYQKAEKQSGQICAIVFPFYASGDLATNINAIWVDSYGDLTPEAVKADLEESRPTVEKGITDAGYTLDSYEYTDPVETDFGGIKCIANDNLMKLSQGSVSADIYQRVLYFGEKGYIINLSAASAEALETAVSWLESVLVWP